MEAGGQVLMEGEPLKHAFAFTYLGYDFRADGKAEHSIQERMRKAALRFSRLCHIWKSKELDTTLKLRLHAAAVVSVLVYGCEAWPITEKVTKRIGAWDARRLSFITNREIRDEYLVPSFGIVARIRARRLNWAGNLIKEKEEVSKKLKELGVEDSLINLKGITQGMLVLLGQRNIKKLSDFADLSSDELIGGYDEIEGKKIRVDGYLEEFSLSREEADQLIMSAREIVFK